MVLNQTAVQKATFSSDPIGFLISEWGVYIVVAGIAIFLLLTYFKNLRDKRSAKDIITEEIKKDFSKLNAFIGIRKNNIQLWKEDAYLGNVIRVFKQPYSFTQNEIAEIPAEDYKELKDRQHYVFTTYKGGFLAQILAVYFKYGLVQVLVDETSIKTTMDLDLIKSALNNGKVKLNLTSRIISINRETRIDPYYNIMICSTPQNLKYMNSIAWKLGLEHNLAETILFTPKMVYNSPPIASHITMERASSETTERAREGRIKKQIG